MSRLFDILLEDDALEDIPRAPPPFVLRRHRRRPLHPEQVAARLREKAASTSPEVRRAVHGWVAILYPENHPRIVREVPPGSTLEEARAALAKELEWTGPCDAWLVMKQHPKQRTVRP